MAQGKEEYLARRGFALTDDVSYRPGDFIDVDLVRKSRAGLFEKLVDQRFVVHRDDRAGRELLEMRRRQAKKAK